MKFFLVALFAAVVCTANADLDSILGHVRGLKKLRQDTLNSIFEKIECHVTAVTEAVKGTDLEEKWSVIKNDIDEINGNIADCIENNQGNRVQTFRCMFAEIKNLRNVVKDFIENLKGDYTEIHNNIQEAFKQC